MDTAGWIRRTKLSAYDESGGCRACAQAWLAACVHACGGSERGDAALPTHFISLPPLQAVPWRRRP